MQAVHAVTSERQQLTQLQSQVGQLAGVLRQLLVSVSNNSSLNTELLLETRPGAAPIKVTHVCALQLFPGVMMRPVHLLKELSNVSEPLAAS